MKTTYDKLKIGDKIKFVKTGGVLPGYTLTGEVGTYPNENTGELYLLQPGKDRIDYIYLSHGGEFSYLENNHE